MAIQRLRRLREAGAGPSNLLAETTFPSNNQKVGVNPLEHCFLWFSSLPGFCREFSRHRRQITKSSYALAHKSNQPRLMGTNPFFGKVY